MLIERLKDVNKICSGYNHMMALSEGSLYSWGKGIDGQLGNGKQMNSFEPTFVSSLGNDVEDVSCGSNHTLVKMVNGKCYSFGNVIYGQLGVGSNKNSSQPIKVNIDSKVDEVAAGENYSLYLSNGFVFGAGDNSSGQIDPSINKKFILDPVKISHLSNVAIIRAGKFSACLTHSGEIIIWGIPCQ